MTKEEINEQRRAIAHGEYGRDLSAEVLESAGFDARTLKIADLLISSVNRFYQRQLEIKHSRYPRLLRLYYKINDLYRRRVKGDIL